ncbi:putative peptidase (DUF1758) domain-containing protein [Phthorimaea operculella]|nr:putative peptidase (DUF1758) domain-containing protein [Phthorimaea operculella]
MLDSGSNVNLVTKELCDNLGLKMEKVVSNVHGIGNSVLKVIGRVSLTFCSVHDQRYKYTVRASVVEELTGELPHTKLFTNDIPPVLKGLQLADQHFHIPGDINCIIGSGLFPHLLLSNKINIPHTELVAVQSTLGYLIMGELNIQGTNQQPTKLYTHFVSADRKLEDLTQRFWELESIQPRKIMSPEEKKCEEIFQESHSRDSTGRYTVSLPLCEDPSVLGDSYQTAKKRLLSLEKKLDSNPELRSGYNNTIQEYLDKGYLKKLSDPIDIQASSPVYNIPHRPVYRPDKDTTKTRIVLNASSSSSSGKSLNDILYTGPNLQSNIFDLLINFRLFILAFSADLEKMYFQLKVKPEHQTLQRILYRFNTQSPIDVYQFDRVAFGLKCSPYLALRVIRQLAQDESQTFPNLVEIVANFSYMDDFLTSLPDEEEALKLYSQLIELFKRGGFNLTKWISNSQNFLEQIPKDSRASKTLSFDADADPHTKIIGLHWNPVEDNFFFSAKSAPFNSEIQYTKRMEDEASAVSLLCAKSRVASGRQTLARLELCAAHLLAKLIITVHNIITKRVQIDKIMAFSDSTITLAWINSSPHKWQTFVANRVAEIQELLAPPHWFHVPGEHNISDLITRPVTPAKLIENDGWFHGPDWMRLPQPIWPVNIQNDVPQHIPEAKLVSFIHVSEPHPIDILSERPATKCGWDGIPPNILTGVLWWKGAGRIKSCRSWFSIILNKNMMKTARQAILRQKARLCRLVLTRYVSY